MATTGSPTWAGAGANGIEVTHAEGLNAEDVADHAIGLMLAAWRNIPALDRIVREGRWKQEERIGSQPSLGGRTLGVVGLAATSGRRWRGARRRYG